MEYRKNPKNLDTRKICCNYPKSWTVWFHDRVICSKDADGMANSVDPDQTAPLVWVYTVCLDLPVHKLRIITVCMELHCRGYWHSEIITWWHEAAWLECRWGIKRCYQQRTNNVNEWATSWQNQQNGMCAQRRLRSAWAAAQSDWRLRCVLNGWLRTHGFFMQTAKTDQTGLMPRPIWVLTGCTVILLVLSWGGSNCFLWNMMATFHCWWDRQSLNSIYALICLKLLQSVLGVNTIVK